MDFLRDKSDIMNGWLATPSAFGEPNYAMMMKHCDNAIVRASFFCTLRASNFALK
jgi:hypothetical protein